MSIKVEIPDIGDFSDVPVIEINVAVGDTVAVDDPLLMLESDKATLDVPSPVAGTVLEILLSVDDLVSEGSVAMTIEQSDAASAGHGNTSTTRVSDSDTPAISSTPSDLHAETVVIGAGPGGYSAAFRCADLNQSVILIDNRDTLGGVCLNVGCIPSKALLHAAKVMDEAEEISEHGVEYNTPKFDIDKVRKRKEDIVAQLTGGLAGLARKRKVTTVKGYAKFADQNQIIVSSDDGEKRISFTHAIIAVGSSPIQLPFLPSDPRIIDSSGALSLEDIPSRLLVLGGGIIGVELGQVYQRFGSEVTVVEMQSQLIPGADKDIVAPLMKRSSSRFKDILLETKVTAVKATTEELIVTFNSEQQEAKRSFDKILVAVGRVSNGKKIEAEVAGVEIDEYGFINVDTQMRTNIRHIFAIGDVVGQPMLAHKAVHEGHVAAEVIAGENSAFDAAVIPSVAYTDPEIAWVGLTETQARNEGIKHKKAVFPWMASGRSLSMGRSDGITKLIFDLESKRLLGAGIVGQGAGDLIAEAVLAIEMGADAEDIALTVHPHPTLSESIGLAAEVFTGSITDL